MTSIRQDPYRLFERKVIQRFLDYLVLNATNDCIEWNGHLSGDGYGKISIGPRAERVKIAAHRWALQFALGGIILPKDIFACHHCDNPRCVNPIHLFPGTHTDNMHDMISKGRSGLRQGNPRLEIEQVQDIKYGNQPYSYYVNKYSITKSTVSYIRNGLSWSEI